MTDQKISALTEATTAAGGDDMAIVQGGTTKRVGVDTLFSTANSVWQGWTMLTAPLTSTSWDGDSFDTTAKTLIDLSAVFSVPAGVKAVLVWVAVRDSLSAANDTFLILSPNNTAASGFFTTPMTVNDRFNRACLVVPCDSNGDIYYQISASGAGNFDVYLQIWGYLQ